MEEVENTVNRVGKIFKTIATIITSFMIIISGISAPIVFVINKNYEKTEKLIAERVIPLEKFNEDTLIKTIKKQVTKIKKDPKDIKAEDIQFIMQHFSIIKNVSDDVVSDYQIVLEWYKNYKGV